VFELSLRAIRKCLACQVARAPYFADPCPTFKNYPFGKVRLKVTKIIHADLSRNVIALHIEMQQNNKSWVFHYIRYRKLIFDDTLGFLKE